MDRMLRLDLPVRSGTRIVSNRNAGEPLVHFAGPGRRLSE